MPNTMPNNKSPDLPSTASDVLRHTPAPRPSLAARVTARLRAHRLDRQLAVGVQAPAGSALAVHQARVTSVAERQAIARALRLSERDFVNALGIVGSMASGIIEYLAEGTWTKRLHAGWAAQSAIRAVDLARSGFIGPRTVLEGTHGLYQAFAQRGANPIALQRQWPARAA